MTLGSALNLIRSASVTVLGSVSYIAYRDFKRYPRMVEAYSNGNLISPFNYNNNEISYFPRPELEDKLTVYY